MIMDKLLDKNVVTSGSQEPVFPLRAKVQYMQIHCSANSIEDNYSR